MHEDKASKEREVHSARHLKQRVEVIHGLKTTEPSGKAHPSTSSEHPKRIHKGAVADKIEDGVDLFSFRDSFCELRAFNFDSIGTKFLQHVKSCLLPSCGNDVSADVGGNINSRATQG